ncbi:hypothetical protein [Quadrisphaera sp. DSM 44207]|uniref:hypothetical protein n=1 Tax=Quadrisphaera sp. DSM 44207 TaxID=1881057 RepID=UPI00087F7B68|nr:hypothetical protein [Quadrisphaera sp. DSM 44207]SDQ73791.1 hypothetical protein SAMN05428996_2610 [Quadrisphaera sp. DSM 44207]
MPRSNRPRPRRGAGPTRPARAQEDEGLAGVSGWGYERAGDGEWHVRTVPGAAAAKAYRCPGCDQVIPPGTPHVVTWPGDDLLGPDAAIGSRRHWHRSCWSARGRRRPR